MAKPMMLSDPKEKVKKIIEDFKKGNITLQEAENRLLDSARTPVIKEAR